MAKDFFIQFLINSKFSFYRRSLFIVFLILCIYIMHLWPDNISSVGILLFIAMMIGVLGPMLLNLFFLVPHMLFKKKYLHYILGNIISLILFYFLMMLSFSNYLSMIDKTAPNIDQRAFLGGIKLYILLMCIINTAFTSMKFFQGYMVDRYKILTFEDSLIHTELDLLKTNISHYFLFKMLNNTEVLIQTEPFKARMLIRKLSEFLRYQLYDTAREKVMLSDDIKFLENFLSLEKVRRDFFDFSINQKGVTNKIEVSPLLFIPFVENAVKNNIQSGTGAFVNLSFKMKDNYLIFTCENPTELNNELGGFGIKNVVRRLDLLYPDKYDLDMFQKKKMHYVHLIVEL